MLNTHDFIQQFPALLHRAVVALRNDRWARIAFRVGGGLVLLPVVFAVFIAFYVHCDRTNLPPLDGFIHFAPPTMGHIYDANGHVLIELGRERRDIIQYEEIPEVVRGAVLSAEDKNFFSHSGVDYSVFLRLVAKTNMRALAAHFTPFSGQDDSSRPLVFPQGGSTLTQQLVRGYFLPPLSIGENGDSLQHEGMLPHVLAFVIGVPGTNKLLLKIETLRLSLWIEDEMRKQYGSKRRAKEELFARYASFVYMGNGRYGFAAASDYYFKKPLETFTVDDADKAALLAGITKSPGVYAPTAEDVYKLTRRRNQILNLMVANRFLSAEAARRFTRAPIRVAAHAAVGPVEAPAAVQAALEELKRIGPDLGSGIGIAQLLEGHIQVHTTVDHRIQRIANEALENAMKAYEKRHPQSKGQIQGSVVVLRNSDSAILAETGGRAVYDGRNNTYSDYNRVSQSRRQPGSAMKPIVYLAAFRQGALNLDTSVPDEPISVAGADKQSVKWIANFDNQFQGMISARQALAESRNVVAVWITSQIGINSVLRTAQDVGIRSKLQPYVSTALGASEVTLLELANAYRLMAGGLPGEPHVIERIQHTRGGVVYSYQKPCCLGTANYYGLSMIQEGLRGAVRIPTGTAASLNSRGLPPVMGKTGTTNNYRDALFVGSTYGPDGITVAVRVGFDDNRSLGARETGARAALPVFREVMLKVYQAKLVGPAPRFPAYMEDNIDAYLRGDLDPKDAIGFVNLIGASRVSEDRTEDCSRKQASPSANNCGLPSHQRPTVYPSKNKNGYVVLTNQ